MWLNKTNYLVDLLVDLGFVTAEQITQTRAEAQSSGVGVVDLLLANKLIRPGDVTQAKAAQFGAEVVQLSSVQIPDDVIAIIPRHLAKKYRVVPVFKTDGKVAVAIADPSDLNTIDTLTHLLNSGNRAAGWRRSRTSRRRSTNITAARKRASPRTNGSRTSSRELTEEGNVVATTCRAKMTAGRWDADAPLIRLVNQISVDAFKIRASDIHLEPLQKRFRLRYRIDGVMQEMKAPPKRLQASIITRLKIQSNMSISEHRIPQDGRIQSKVGNKLIDLRVSCLPTNHGESIVMRILDKEGLKLGLPELGFFTDDQQTFERIIGLPDGILLVTGPTGSGKTTTLYSCLHFINRPDRKIITVEDPVEYVLAGINQVQVSGRRSG